MVFFFANILLIGRCSYCYWKELWGDHTKKWGATRGNGDNFDGNHSEVKYFKKLLSKYKKVLVCICFCGQGDHCAAYRVMF